MRYTVAVDFDGVIHSYITKWQGHDIIPDPPIPGAIEWLNGIAEEFDVVIHTTRGATDEGIAAVREWLAREGCRFGSCAVVTNRKPPALIYLDDRAWRFDGTYPTAEQIHRAHPWKVTGVDASPRPGGAA